MASIESSYYTLTRGVESQSFGAMTVANSQLANMSI